MPTLHINLLGDFLLKSDDTPITTVTLPRLQSLLAYLVLHQNVPQDRSHLAFLLWPDSTEAQAHTNLRKLLYQLRQALPDADRYIHADKHRLHWQPTNDIAPWTLDTLELEQAVAEAEQARHTQDNAATRQALEHVIHLYHGNLLPACYDEWILPERDRLHQLFLTAAEHLIALLEQERAYAAAIATAQQLLRHEPLHEATYRQLMRLYALCDDRAAALRTYHTCARLLEAELGIEPGQATRAIYESLVQSDPSPKTTTGPLPGRRTEAPLIGRKAEWRQLQDAWRAVTNGHPHIVILSGEAGIGKTRLAEEMEAWVSRQGLTSAIAHCYAADGRLAYAPVATWLRTDTIQKSLFALDAIWLSEVARLVPDILIKLPKLPRPTPMTEEWQRQHYFEALAHAFSQARQPLLLVLDDLQWCDDETLAWLHYLIHFEPKIHLLLIGTVRSDEILPGHPLLPLLQTLQRNSLVTEIALNPLTTPEMTTLVEHIVGHQLDTVTMNKLYAETEGNPLFVVEMVRAGTMEQYETPSLVASNTRSLLTPTSSNLPTTIQTVLSARLAQLSPLARDVANVAAVIGRAFTFTTLARASSESEDAVVRGLDELWQRRIIQEQHAEITEIYDFSHDKLRAHVYTSLSPAHRRLLHRRVAEALEHIYADDLDAISGQLAAHYEHAGLPSQAISCYRRAGSVAFRVYANAEAITAFQRAATLMHASTERHTQTQHWQEATAIYTALGEIFAMTGRQEEARKAYQDGIASIPAAEALPVPTTPFLNTDNPQLSYGDQRLIWLARLLRKKASTWNLASNNPQDTFHINARQTSQEAEQILEQVTNKSSAEWLHEWIDLHIDRLLPLRGSVEEMTATIEKIEVMVDQHGTAEQRGQFFQAVVARDSKRDRYVASEETLLYCRNALAALQQTSNTSLMGFAHFVLGNRLLWADILDEAESEMHAALRIAEQVGNTRLLVRTLTFLPLIFRRRGQVAEVRAIVTRAMTIPAARNITIIKGHQAWLAWRAGNLTEAETYGRTSLEERPGEQRTNAFHWIGLWPLIGIALTQEKMTDAIHYVRMLLDPTQQLPPEQLGTSLEKALHAWDVGQQQEASLLLQQIIPLATEMGYL